MIDQAKIDEINEKTDIVELVSQYVKLEKAGSDYRGLCPFHDEKTPSFMVSPSKKFAVCMGCHAGGKPITFLQKIKRISFEEACVELAEKANVELNIKNYHKGPDYSKYYKIMEEAAKFYHYTLLNTVSGQKAIEYLKNRGITDELIEEFNIGLAPNKNDALYLTLKNQDSSFTEIDMLDCGLIKQSEKDSSFFDLFKNRIMFPVRDKANHVIAFSGRIFNGEQDQAKYINSPETVIFEKNKSIYHIDKAQSKILKSKRIILHEGQMDVIAATKAGFSEAVCSMGTALTNNQLKLLHEFSDNIVLCYDGDSAGINAMVKSIKLIKNASMNLSLVRLPDGMDPDEYVNKYGVEKYKEYFETHIESPNDFLYEYIRTDKKNLSLDEIENVKLRLFKFLNTLSSRVLTEGYLKRFSDDTGVSYASLMIDFNTFLHQAGFIDNSNSNTNVVNSQTKTISILKNDFNDDDWSNMLYRLRAQLKLFKYAMTSKENAKKLDSIIENRTPLYMCFDKQHQSLWITLINDYYEFNETFNEGLFYKLLTQSQYNCWISDLSTLKNEIKEDNFTQEEIDSSINACYKSYEEKVFNEQNKNFSTLSEEDQIKALMTKVSQMQAIDRKRKKKEK